MTEAIGRLEHAGKVYGTQVRTRALQPTDLDVRAGEVLVLLGPSGSGKTTMLNLLGGLDTPSEGHVVVAGRELDRLDRKGLTAFRRECIGFVFQFFNLVPSLTARENVLVTGEIVGATPADADAWLAKVGLDGLGDRFPQELSGGQQQRVAIARALAKKPSVLLADEPTGALDHDAGGLVIGLLAEAAHARGCAVVIVTHDESTCEHADRVVRLRDGRVISDKPKKAAS